MRIERKFYMVAMVIFAVLLCTTNVHAAKLIMGAGDGGSIATYPAFDTNGELQVNRNETVVFTLTPETNFQVDDFIRGGSAPKNNGSILTMFPDACTVATTTGVMTCTLTDFIDNFTFDATFAAIPVVASFVTDQPSGSEAGISVQFTDTSDYIDNDTNQNTWNWNFGDGNTSTEQNPVHTFAVGTHNVTLTVTNQTTQSTDSYTMAYTAIQPTIAYQASALGNGSISPSGFLEAYEGVATTFTIAPDSLYQVADVVLDKDMPGETSVLGDCVFNGVNASYTFPVEDTADHTITASFEPIPIVANFGFSTASGEMTTDDEFLFTDNSQGSSLTWDWDFGDGTTLTGADSQVHQNPVHTFEQDGDYIVTLTVRNAATEHTTNVTLTVDPSSSPKNVKSGNTEYDNIQSAYDSTSDGETIMMKASVEFSEALVFDRFITLELKGGYDDTFGSATGFTRINGKVTVRNGTVKMSEVIIASAPAI